MYICRLAPFWDFSVGSPWLYVGLHSSHVLLFGTYFLFNLWMIQRDALTVDLLKPDDKKRYLRYVELSFRAKIYLLFGTPVLWRAFLMPARHYIPLNGLEYEHEQMSHGDELRDYANFQWFTLENV